MLFAQDISKFGFENKDYVGNVAKFEIGIT